MFVYLYLEILKPIIKNLVYKVQTICELHEIVGFDKPKHPLITVVDYSKVDVKNAPESGSFMCSFYSINFKKHCNFLYGRQPFDHKEGTLHCVAPGQVITFDRKKEESSTEGWGLYFHPELIRNNALGDKISDYTFFTYSENEALQLSEQEKQILLSILKQMEIEYNTNIDQYSKELIVSNIELLLNYCKRFYGRQFITRVNQNKNIIIRFEKFISDYFNSNVTLNRSIPSVKYCADAMNLSPNYFSDLLKSQTGKNTQEHIHYYLLEKAKNLLISSDKSINEIAYELGFEYPQNFSKLFKKKLGVSPTIYRTA
ncbi:MAG: helix-turn-helix transcriptional regulator [Bacteroidales bacterium]|nr:helix-turn-helix transcriptional regulator [Bacteroidales bacterium]